MSEEIGFMGCDQLFLKGEMTEYTNTENPVHKTRKLDCLFEICVVVIYVHYLYVIIICSYV